MTFCTLHDKKSNNCYIRATFNMENVKNVVIMVVLCHRAFLW